MQRRNLIRGLTASIAGAAVSATTTVCAQDKGNAKGPAKKRPTFVFVHGAWHGGWCWSEVVRLLGERGFAAVALDLPGHGPNARLPQSYLQQPQNAALLATEASPLAALTLTDYRDHTLNLLRGLTDDGDAPAILVGHSLGGATLTAVAEAAPHLLRRLVYLTAFVPVAYNNVLAYLGQPNFTSALVPSLFVANPANTGCARINQISTDPTYAALNKLAFYGDVGIPAYQGVANLLTPDEPIQAFTTPVVVTANRWGRVPRTYIRCTEDRAIPIAGQDQMIAEADALTPHNRFVQKTLHTSHSPFISAPKAVADLLLAQV